MTKLHGITEVPERNCFLKTKSFLKSHNGTGRATSAFSTLIFWHYSMEPSATSREWKIAVDIYTWHLSPLMLNAGTVFAWLSLCLSDTLLFSRKENKEKPNRFRLLYSEPGFLQNLYARAKFSSLSKQNYIIALYVSSHSDLPFHPLIYYKTYLPFFFFSGARKQFLNLVDSSKIKVVIESMWHRCAWKWIMYLHVADAESKILLKACRVLLFVMRTRAPWWRLNEAVKLEGVSCECCFTLTGTVLRAAGSVPSVDVIGLRLHV